MTNKVQRKAVVVYLFSADKREGDSMKISCNKIILENVIITDSSMEKSDATYEESVKISKAAEKRHRKIQGKKERIFNKCNGKCCFCGMRLQMENPNEKDYMTLDHITAKCKGGTSRDDNLQALCWTCNELKSQLDNDTFIDAAIRAGRYLYFQRLFGKIRNACKRICLL